MANKDFIWFLSDSINYLQEEAINSALNDLLDRGRFGKEGNRYFILTDSEDEWRTKMKKLKEHYEFHMTHKFLISFSSDEKAKRAREYLDQRRIPFDVNTSKDNEVVVYCTDIKQKHLIKEIKNYVNSHIKRHVII